MFEDLCNRTGHTAPRRSTRCQTAATDLDHFRVQRRDHARRRDSGMAPVA